MATYTLEGENEDDLTLEEFSMYGSSRLGVERINKKITNISISNVKTHTLGEKSFEISNHLGNVICTFSDLKKPENCNGSVNEYNACLQSSVDYFPFGSTLPERSYNADRYRFGFNGKENDNEGAGTGSWQNYGMREYDTRIVRFISLDPLTKEYPELTPFQFASNTPIQAIDLDGKEAQISQYLPNYAQSGQGITPTQVGHLYTTTASYILNSPSLVVTGIVMPIVGNIYQGISGDMYYPSWAVPYTFDDKMKPVARNDMMGPSIPWESGKEALSATASCVLPPLFVEAGPLENAAKNFVYQTVVSESINYIPPNNSNTPTVPYKPTTESAQTSGSGTTETSTNSNTSSGGQTNSNPTNSSTNRSTFPGSSERYLPTER